MKENEYNHMFYIYIDKEQMYWYYKRTDVSQYMKAIAKGAIAFYYICEKN